MTCQSLVRCIELFQVKTDSLSSTDMMHSSQQETEPVEVESVLGHNYSRDANVTTPGGFFPVFTSKLHPAWCPYVCILRSLVAVIVFRLHF